ncbi:hypothetical protein [Komagataeibacter medellinensis]|nr:hypothetical protein [Komagataeibacter medellinensis]
MKLFEKSFSKNFLNDCMGILRAGFQATYKKWMRRRPAFVTKDRTG